MGCLGSIIGLIFGAVGLVISLVFGVVGPIIGVVALIIPALVFIVPLAILALVIGFIVMIVRGDDKRHRTSQNYPPDIKKDPRKQDTWDEEEEITPVDVDDWEDIPDEEEKNDE